MESYHIPRGPKTGFWFADQAGLDQFLVYARKDKDVFIGADGKSISMFQATDPLAEMETRMPLHIATEDDLTILRSGVAAIIDVWNYGVDSPQAARRKPDLDRITAAMYRRQERAAKKQKWNA